MHQALLLLFYSFYGRLLRDNALKNMTDLLINLRY